MTFTDFAVLEATKNITDGVDKKINDWLRLQLSKGIDPDMIVGGLTQLGFTKAKSTLIVGLARQDVYLGEGGSIIRMGPVAVLAPHAEQHQVEAGDFKVRKLMSMDSLDVVLYENFLTDEECAHLINISEPKLRRSMVIGAKDNMEAPIRTSDGAFLPLGMDPVVERLERRIAQVTGMPVENGEDFQVLRYKDTQDYKPHFDFFDPFNPGEARQIDAAGNRMGTMLLYLSDVEEGGSTYFPQLRLSIHPKKCNALWFGYIQKDGLPNKLSEHAGLPVIQGEKWLATKWIRQKKIRRG